MDRFRKDNNIAKECIERNNPIKSYCAWTVQ